MKLSMYSLTDQEILDKELPFVDVTKFICALLVVTIHTNAMEDIHPLLNHVLVNYLARLAVPFFFISAGYFLFRKTDVSNLKQQVIIDFIKRIFRLYVVWSLIYLAPAISAELKGGATFPQAIAIWIKNFIFSGSYGHLWYLNALIVACLINYVLIKQNVRVERILGISFVFYLIGLLGQSYYVLIRPVQSVPAIWNVILMIMNVISTTRDGLFEGWFFMAIGMYLAYRPLVLKKKTMVLSFVIVMALFFVEFIAVSHFDFALSYDMYLFLGPAAFLLFYIAAHIKITGCKWKPTLRNLSSLVYYSHMWIVLLIPKAWHSLVRFGATAVVTCAFAVLLLKLRQYKCFGWIKWLL